MVFIGGWGDKSKILGNSKLVQCENCNNVNSFNVVEKSKRVSAYFIPIIKWNYRYYLLCPVCSYGFELEDKQSGLNIVLDAYKY